MTIKVKLFFGLLTGLFAGLLYLPAQAAPEQLETVGYAKEIGTNKLVYTENHSIQVDGDNIIAHKVEYKDASGQVFATKTLDYSQARYAPSFRLEDKRDGYIEGGENTAQGYRLFVRKSTNDDMDSDVLDKPDRPLISDAGFNTFMVDNLKRLDGGEEVEIEMTVAGRLASYGFRGRKSGNPTVLGRPAVEVTTEPSSRLLRALVDPLKISYDKETGRLLAYEGVSNIRDAKGDRYEVRIEFPNEDVNRTPLSGQE